MYMYICSPGEWGGKEKEAVTETTSVEVCYERIGFHIDKHNYNVVS